MLERIQELVRPLNGVVVDGNFTTIVGATGMTQGMKRDSAAVALKPGGGGGLAA